MLRPFTKIIAVAALAGSAPLLAETSNGYSAQSGASQARELPAYLQCVPYAREQSGVSIYGDAHTWWGQAEGRFERGSKPRVGAVMAFQPHRNMRLGHVAAVSKIVDSRTILLRHANWSPINGRRGQIENDVRAIDVSPNNDWSQVRVWYDPIKNLGKTAWPIHGFIYSDKVPQFSQPTRVARAPTAQPQRQVSPRPSRRFASAFSDLSAQPAQQAAQRTVRAAPRVAPASAPRRNNGTVNERVNRAVSLYD